jgi:hypothetical protein
MTTKQFNEIAEEQLNRIRNFLIVKGAEYNLDEGDRFSDFKQAAAFSEQTPEQVLYGYMLKHWTSLTGMIQSKDAFTSERWTEKITDSMVYLTLLLGLVADTPRCLTKDTSTESV